MTPKEKAKQLRDRYFALVSMTHAEWDLSKQCALIAVDEILSDYKNYLMHENTEYKGLKYWQEVKKEIEKL